MAVNGALYGGVQIGDYAYGTPDDTPNLLTETIPRATGVVLKFLGGGLQTVTVTAWVINFAARRRKELEEYLRDLAGNLNTQSPASLTINGVTYTNSFYNGISVSDDGHHWARFTVEFLRSSGGGVC